MAYSFVKARGRVSIFKGGEFDHQQFRGHYAFRNPELYVEHLEEQDREAAEYADEVKRARIIAVNDYLERRAVRNAAQPKFAF